MSKLINWTARTGQLGVAIGFAALAPIVQAATPADCDAALLEQISGRYEGQQLGFRSELNIASAASEGCRIEARWETFNDRAPMATGVAELVLADGVLTGDWRSGEEMGKVRFDVLRNGDVLNGRMLGMKGLPDGPWDYVKAPAAPGEK